MPSLNDINAAARGAPEEHRTAGPLLAALTTAIVRLQAAHFGKGPTRAKSFWAGDALVCQMEESLTPGERALIARGKVAEVLALRRGFHDAMEPEFIAEAERLSGRSVRAFFGQIHLATEIDIKVFVLHGAQEDGRR
jgi:uncharacterized protein YbcI